MIPLRPLTRSANTLTSCNSRRSIFTTASLLNMKPIQVYTFGTPNGWPVTAALHELKAGNPSQDLKWESKSIDIMKNIQKEPWFLKINPNGRIPAIVDPNYTSDEHPDGFPVWETSAILLYLEKRYDPGHVLSWGSEEVSPEKADELRSEVLQWMFFAHGGVGPMQGECRSRLGEDWIDTECVYAWTWRSHFSSSPVHHVVNGCRPSQPLPHASSR